MARAADEPVRLTRIYTRGGDGGATSLGDGSRVSKLDTRIAAFGTTDELNALIGVVLAGECPVAIRAPLELIQNELFDVGADLCVPWPVEGRLRVEQSLIDGLEALCDSFNESLSMSSRASFFQAGHRRQPGCTWRAPSAVERSATYTSR